MANLNYWSGTAWLPISGGGGGGTPGPQGPPGEDGKDGKDGESIVVTEQASQPADPVPGQIWFKP